MAKRPPRTRFTFGNVVVVAERTGRAKWALRAFETDGLGNDGDLPMLQVKDVPLVDLFSVAHDLLQHAALLNNDPGKSANELG